MKLIDFIAKLIYERYNQRVVVSFSENVAEHIIFNDRITFIHPSDNLIICDWNDGDHRKSYKITDFQTWIEHWADRIK